MAASKPRKTRAKANGEGSIFSRVRNGRKLWYAELVVGWDVGEDGKPKKKVLRSPGKETKEEARGWMTDRQKARQDGTLSEPTKQTVAQFLTHWLDTDVSHRVRERTVHDYRENLRRYIAPAIGRTELQKLTPPQVQAFYHDLQTGKGPTGRQLSPSTVRAVHAVLSPGLQRAVEWSLLARNPCDSVTLPPLKRKKFTPLTQEQANAFLDVAQHDRLHALWILDLSTGLRRGELLGLRWQDVDLDAGQLEVHQTLNVIGTRLVMGEPKTQSSQDTVVIPRAAIVALKRWKAEQNQERFRIGSAWQTDLVFTTTIGTPINPANLRKWFKSLLQQAGCPNVRIHDLRHTAATLLIDAGVQPTVVQKILRHSEITTTLRFYVHTDDGRKKEAAEVMNDLLAARRKSR